MWLLPRHWPALIPSCATPSEERAQRLPLEFNHKSPHAHHPAATDPKSNTLAFAREEGAEEARKADLTSLVESVAADLAELGRPVLFEDAPRVPLVCRASSLRRAVRNLIENADKYSPPNRPIEVALSRVGNGDVRISVSDQGIGIPTDDLARIFDRFQRGSNASGTTRGSGLGLSVVALLVEAMGGRLSVESQLERGSRFHIDLPEPRPAPSRPAQ